MSNMNIVIMNGGLGNQLYQYAFSRFLELSTKTPSLIDDSAFCGLNPSHNGYELEKIFHLKLNLLSNFFSRDVWEEMMQLRMQGVGIAQQFLKSGVNLTMIAEFSDHLPFNGNIVYFPPNGATKELLYTYTNTRGNFYYHGYWVRPVYFNHIREILLSELVFPDLDTIPELPSINKQYALRITETDSVAVHIRRGDFVKIGRALPRDKYNRAVKNMEKNYAGCTYFVFSDDIEWCKANRKELGLMDTIGEVVYIEGNTIDSWNYIDMQLMSLCKKMIISNSSFGQWAYFLNKTPDLVVLVADNI